MRQDLNISLSLQFHYSEASVPLLKSLGELSLIILAMTYTYLPGISQGCLSHQAFDRS